MGRPFLFLAGEFQVSMPLVFSRESWQHTMSARKLVENGDGTLRRDNVGGEHLRGVLYFAGVDSEDVRRHNLELLTSLRFPCWPDPAKLLALDDRHVVMRECVSAGLVDHPVRFVHHGERVDLPHPFVLKTGNEHRGEGKHLIASDADLPRWDGVATAEPFFRGTSARVLIIGPDVFCLRFDNPRTWIKNAAGADVAMWQEMPESAVAHALRVHHHFGLDVSGVDYVIEENGVPRFLEINQFPGLGADETIETTAREFLARRMADVETMADART